MINAQLRQAPRLYHNMNMYRSKGYYQMPQSVLDAVFQQLDGKSGGQIKLMVALLGTKGDGSFRISQQWIKDRTGLSQPAYNRARNALIDKGWLVYDAGCLTVDVREIMRGAEKIVETSDI